MKGGGIMKGGKYCTPAVSLLLALSLPALFPSAASAIPAFSRQHKAECTTCHTIYPELNEFGDAFYKNAFVWPGKSPAEKQQEGEPQAEHPAGKKNEALRLAGIPDLVPISFSANQTLKYDPHAIDRFDLSSRFFTLQAGGAFRDKAGFFATYLLYTEGMYDPTISNVPGNQDHNIGELYLVWRHAAETPVNLKVGRFRPQLSLWKANRKSSVTPFAPQTYTVGRSRFMVDSTGDALEANAIVGRRVFAAAGIVDRPGQNTKEGYGHLSFRLGGADFHAKEPEVSLESDSIWDYLAVTVGTYAYFGRNALTDGSGKAVVSNDFYRAGVDADVRYKRASLRFSGVRGNDNNPEFEEAADKTDSLVLAVGGEYFIGSTVIAALRYEFQDVGETTVRRYIPSLAYMPLQNLKVSAEYKHEDAPEVVNRITQLSLTYSF